MSLIFKRTTDINQNDAKGFHYRHASIGMSGFVLWPKRWPSLANLKRIIVQYWVKI